MSKLPNDCICLFYFQVGWGGGLRVTTIESYAWEKNCNIWSSLYRCTLLLRQLRITRIKKYNWSTEYLILFFWTNPWNSIEKGCHSNCVTFLAFLTTYFDEHFFWKEIFQWYFVGTGILWNYRANSFYGSKKIESYVWEKNCNIWSSLYHCPLLLRQLKNNQNQTNTRFIHFCLEICQWHLNVRFLPLISYVPMIPVFKS
jgi:hypothetical protein